GKHLHLLTKSAIDHVAADNALRFAHGVHDESPFSVVCDALHPGLRASQPSEKGVCFAHEPPRSEESGEGWWARGGRRNARLREAETRPEQRRWRGDPRLKPSSRQKRSRS